MLRCWSTGENMRGFGSRAFWRSQPRQWKKTPNAERPTSNAQFQKRRWTCQSRSERRGSARGRSGGRRARRTRRGRNLDRLADLQSAFVLDTIEFLQFIHGHFVHLRDGGERFAFGDDVAVPGLRRGGR